MATDTYGAGLNHVQIKIAAGTVFDVEAAINLEGGIESNEVEIKGDDVVKATFFQGFKAPVTIECNALPMDVLAQITGASVEAVVTPDGDEIGLGGASEANPPFVEVKGQIVAKAVDGTAATIELTFHKVQLKAPPLAGALETEFSISLEGVAYQTADDIEGNALTTKRIVTVGSIDSDVTP